MTETHQHESFAGRPELADPLGRPVDYDLLDRFMGAAFERCVPCQDALGAELAEDGVTAARLVEVACVVIASILGALPAALTSAEAPGLASPEFRRLARAGAGGQNGAMSGECAAMTAAERRRAIETAADLLIGQVGAGVPLPPVK